uniref:Uncharacterized protein n=1 Tax=Romanomermis culicivorax TaxID=13658 RepID=A0A915HXK5_ROMCU
MTIEITDDLENYRTTTIQKRSSKFERANASNVKLVFTETSFSRRRATSADTSRRSVASTYQATLAIFGGFCFKLMLNRHLNRMEYHFCLSSFSKSLFSKCANDKIFQPCYKL